MSLRFREPEPLVPPADFEVIDALEQARQFLSNGRNLAKRNAIDWVNGWHCYCIVAAITAASRTTQIRTRALDATRRALPGKWGWKATIEQYNDAPDTTLEDAKTLLQRAKSNVGSYAA